MIISNRVVASHCLAIAALVSQAICAAATLSQTPLSAGADFQELPFPISQMRYKAKIFELAKNDENKYDREFALQLSALLAPQLKRDSKFFKKIMSGPTADGIYLIARNTSYVYYGICQAHQCNLTNLDILIESTTKKMIGHLLNKCESSWLGKPDDIEKNILNNLHADSFTPPSAIDCENAK